MAESGRMVWSEGQTKAKQLFLEESADDGYESSYKEYLNIIFNPVRSSETLSKSSKQVSRQFLPTSYKYEKLYLYGQRHWSLYL